MFEEKRISEPVVSVVLPVHNGEKYLEESIKSILNQTYKNFELIIVNDMSTDTTPLILQRMAEQDSRIRIVNNRKNLKLPRSLNKGFKIAKGDYFTWTSDDNLYKADAFEKMVKYLSGNTNCDFVFSKIEYIDKNGELCGDAEYINGNLEELPFSNCIGACFMYCKAVHKKLGGYNPKKFLVEDYDFWLRVNRFFKMGFIPESLYFYRNHSGSLTATRSEQIKQGRIGLYEDELKWRTVPFETKVMLCKEIADYYYKRDDFKLFQKYMNKLKKYSEAEFNQYKGYFDEEKLKRSFR